MSGPNPPHVHVESGEMYAKIWLEPVEIAKSEGHNPKHLRAIRQLVEQYCEEFLERRHEHFDSR